MDRVFDVSGTARATLIFRGLCIKAKEEFQTTMTEGEYLVFRDYIDIQHCREIKAIQEDVPVVEVKASNPETIIAEVATPDEDVVAEENKPKGDDNDGVEMSKEPSKTGYKNKNKV